MSLSRRMVTGFRWWFGTTWALLAIGTMVASLIMVMSGNTLGLYLWSGAIAPAAAAWFVHPWGFVRRREPRLRTAQ